jgi:rhodanese-related sulfurtransferase
MDDSFFNGGFISAGIMNVTPRLALSLCQKGAILVDVREAYMSRFKMPDVPETIYCPYSILGETYQHLPFGKPMIFVDSTGIHSGDAVTFLNEKGLGSLIANLAGGLVEWERDEMPVVIDKSEQLSGSCMCQLRPRGKEK